MLAINKPWCSLQIPSIRSQVLVRLPKTRPGLCESQRTLQHTAQTTR